MLLFAARKPCDGPWRWQHRRNLWKPMVAGPADPPISGNGDPISEEEALRRLRLSDDPSAQYYAAWWLGRNRSSHPDAVPLLQEALRQRRPRDAGAGVEENAVARNAARALGKLGGRPRPPLTICWRPWRTRTMVCGKPRPAPWAN